MTREDLIYMIMEIQEVNREIKNERKLDIIREIEFEEAKKKGDDRYKYNPTRCLWKIEHVLISRIVNEYGFDLKEIIPIVRTDSMVYVLVDRISKLIISISAEGDLT